MELHTFVEIPKIPCKIDYSKNLFFMGSCFTENVGLRFKDLFFNSEINPFGVIYNPASVLKCLDFLFHKKEIKESDLFYHNGLWHSFLHHSYFSASDKLTVLKNINESIKLASDFLKKTDFLFITFGTARIYSLKDNQQVVANCHKLPDNTFDRKMLTIDEIVSSYSDFFEEIKKKNNNIQIVLTVSPIRHLKDGAIGNQLSKAVLVLAVDELVRKHDFVHYFPAYEIVLDELRDYRYYDSDMIHISETAIEYIWEKLKNEVLEENTKQLVNNALKLRKSISHKIFNSSSEEVKKFAKNIDEQIKYLKKNFENINLKEAEEYLKNLNY